MSSSEDEAPAVERRGGPGFGALAMDDSSSDEDAAPAPVAKRTEAPARGGKGGKAGKSTKTKGKKGRAPAPAEDSSEEEEEEDVAPPPAVPMPAAGKGKKGKKGKKASSRLAAELEELEAQLRDAGLDEDDLDLPEVAAAPVASGGGGKKGKKGAAGGKGKGGAGGKGKEKGGKKGKKDKEEEEEKKEKQRLERELREKEEKEKKEKEEREAAEAAKKGRKGRKGKQQEGGERVVKKSRMVDTRKKKQPAKKVEEASPKVEEKVESSKAEKKADVPAADGGDWDDDDDEDDLAAAAAMSVPAPAPAVPDMSSALDLGLDDDDEAAFRDGLGGFVPPPVGGVLAGAAGPSVGAAGGGGAMGGGDDDSDSDDWADEVDAVAEEEKERARAAAAAKARAEAEADATEEEKIEASRERRADRLRKAKEERSLDRLRSPICVVLGHVDTGKTSLLDKIRRTNVQGGEAGGITQQIGATYFPMDQLKSSTDKVKRELELEYRIPGLLVVDTPGHESFSNLRSRGSSLCDIAVLVVDLMHGLEPQTLESLNLLRKGKTPFIVALNKVDRCYGWEAQRGSPIRDSLASQKGYTVDEFERRTADVIAEFATHGLTAKLYYENEDFKRHVSLVPTSAVTGEGVPDLLMLLVQLTQGLMANKLRFVDYVQATVLEVKTVEGLGTTVDVILVNGELHEGQKIVLCGRAGPIVTNVRALLTPPPAKEIRVKGEYVHHKTLTAAMGVKIAAPGLESAIAGTSLLTVHPDDYMPDLEEEVQADLGRILDGLKTEDRGVWVQASTLGSLEALLEYLRSQDPPIPVSGVALGPVHRRDVMAASAMLDRSPEFAVMLCFDVRVTPEARAYAEETGVRVFTADIIYHLTDQFEALQAERAEAARRAKADLAVFPCVAKIVPGSVFNRCNPFIFGVEVKAGVLKVGTPMCVIVGENPDGSPTILPLGRIASAQVNYEDVDDVRPGGPGVAIKIEPKEEFKHVTFGRHFEEKHLLYSHISRESIDTLKDHFRKDMKKEDWVNIIKLKKVFKIE